MAGCSSRFMVREEYRHWVKEHENPYNMARGNLDVYDPLFVLDFDKTKITFDGYVLDRGTVRFETPAWASLEIENHCQQGCGADEANRSGAFTLQLSGPNDKQLAPREGTLKVFSVPDGKLVAEYRIKQNGNPALYEPADPTPTCEELLADARTEVAMLKGLLDLG